MPLFRDLRLPRQPRVFEWCAGPGFIGFALLGYGFCDTLCLADVNPEAVEACRLTVAQGLADRVTVYHSDNLEGIPTSEQWDLVVGNPRILSTYRRVNCGTTMMNGGCTDASSP